MCLIWGTTYLGIRIALETLPPLLMAAFRWICAGSILLGALKLRGERIPRIAAWGPLAVLGILLLGFGNGGVVWAERTVPSGLTAVLVATSPFWMVGIDALLPGGDTLTARRIAGLMVGFSGILVLVWPDVRLSGPGGGQLGGVIAAQLACLGWALGSSYARRRERDENVLAAAALQMVFGGAILLAAGLLRREAMASPFSERSLIAWAYLTFVGAIGGFSAYAFALKHLPISTTSLYAYVNPVIAIGLGTLVLNEPFTWRTVVGAAIVFAGVVLVRDRS